MMTHEMIVFLHFIFLNLICSLICSLYILIYIVFIPLKYWWVYLELSVRQRKILKGFENVVMSFSSLYQCLA